MKRVHIIVTGRVQGVFFRANTRDKGRQLGLNGWVRNAGYDQVEVIAEGDDDKIRELVDYCRQGPPAAHVDDIKVKFEEPKKDLGPFSIRY
ncbi:acylphosphatase [Candidatus Woesearchaeota archaeon]|nr:acylphosphatase [Candidatus Woesearchaeota archaeon]